MHYDTLIYLHGNVPVYNVCVMRHYIYVDRLHLTEIRILQTRKPQTHPKPNSVNSILLLHCK